MSTTVSTEIGVHWIKKRACALVGGIWDESNSATLETMCKDFLVSGGVCVFYLSPTDGQHLFASTTVPEASGIISTVTATNNTTFSSKVAYFISKPGSQINDLTTIIWGETTVGNGVSNLLSIMEGVFKPALYNANDTWPESTRREFKAGWHRFMASLTETSHIIFGRTVLYVPESDTATSATTATTTTTSNKDMLQTLEGSLISWTRQIKEAIANQESNNDTDELTNSGPLAELEFWSSKAADLSSIHDQLAAPRVREIVNTLREAKSSYVDGFEQLSESILAGSLEAQDNLRFLSLLREPCELLTKAEPRGIPALLPKILHTIRYIASHSPYYSSSSERVSGLLTKVSNEVMMRCAAKINLKNVFDPSGDVSIGSQDLRDSIEAMRAWRLSFAIEKACIAKAATNPGSKEKPWDFAETGVFAYLDAFIKRCRDLLEICEGQAQFARRRGSGRARAPSFGGSGGLDIMKGLAEVERAFERQLAQLRNLDYNALDVKATRWHDDFGSFLKACRDLELMLVNLINGAFDSTPTISSGTHLVALFRGLLLSSHNDGETTSAVSLTAADRAVERKAAEVIGRYLNDLGHVKEAFEHGRKQPPVLRQHPPAAGAALWAQMLLNRVDSQWALFPPSFVRGQPTADARLEAEAEHGKLSSALHEYITRTHSKWVSSIESNTENIRSQLSQPVVIRDPTSGLLECAFPVDVVVLLDEVYYWKQIGLSIPPIAEELYTSRFELRKMREGVAEVVRRCNAVSKRLGREEKGMFKERVEFLESSVQPGMETLSWEQTGSVIEFATSVSEAAADVGSHVSQFKQGAEAALERAGAIAALQFFSARKKACARAQDFAVKQQAHRTKAAKTLESIYNEIVNDMKKCKESFTSSANTSNNNSNDELVSKSWASFVKKVDEAIRNGLLQSVRSSLLDLEHSISGSIGNNLANESITAESSTPTTSSESQPLIQVSAGLGTSGVAFSPTTDELISMLSTQAREIVSSATSLHCLCETLGIVSTDNSSTTTTSSFSESISSDSEVVSLIRSVELSAQAPSTATLDYAAQWDKNYRQLWEENKDAFIRRYSKPVRPLTKFEEDIKRYQDLAAEIERAEGITPISYMLIDCSALKLALIAHCNQWQSKLTGLLGQIASKELHDIHDLFEENSHKLKSPPRNLEMLKSSTDLLKQMQEEVPKIEARFEPLDAMYKVLRKYEVQIDPAEVTLKEQLLPTFETFKQTLVETDQLLKQKREKFKADLVHQAKEFAITVTKAREELVQKGPTTSSISPDKAFKLIAEFHAHIDRISEKDAQIRAGLEMFQMEAPVNRELVSTQRDLEMLEKVWQLADEWGKTWEEWRSVRFSDINVQKMEEEAQKFQKRLVKLGKDIKGMEVWATLKEKVDQFAAGMPLIMDLKNPALRPRHWERLKEEIGKPFDPTSPVFTLDTVFALGFDNYADVIGNISLSATKELAIEQSLKDIETKWDSLTLEIAPHKDAGHFKLHSADEVFQALEDHKVVLSDMKASKYFFAFESQVERWERTLSHVLETLEMILKVQRLWLYLENIFTATEDIRKQLPAESAIFEKVDHTWKGLMCNLAKEPNALRGTHAEGLLESLIDANTKLEKVQHSLNQYLESKRRLFPRFYFISDRDLLEILGQAKDPTAVQRHLIKLFDNINQLEFVLSTKDKKKHEAVKMISGEGEEVPFIQSVPCEGGVETWLQVLEAQMGKTLNKEMYQALMGFAKFRKEKPAKQEKFLKTTPGQLIIAASEITFTQSCTHALTEIETGGNKSAMNDLRKKQAAMLHVLSDMVRSQLPPLSRLKLVALLTIEIHHRDIIERLIRDGITSEKDFGWRSQLRFYWEKEAEECVIRQTDFSFQYGYEYLGNTGRLVITQLTDKVYLALTTALMLKKGSSPQGPAGTGKTETVKDLAKAVGKFCVVFNSSEKVDVISMARSLAGLSQSGAWGCFDEFNRIDTQVLSVVAIQISSILSAIAAGKRRFVFPMFEEIVLKPGTGIFITMNPGYAGRSELPDNLKSLFRPVIMWTPDSSMIAEIMLFSEGFSSTKTLARKIVTLFQLCSQQLSKQDHYDFTLRSIKSVLVASGTLKRREPDAPEEVLLLRALRDMNLPKFVGEDIQLFLGITTVLFPGVEIPDTMSSPLQQSIEAELQEQGLQVHQPLINKIMQLRQTKQTRHGVMIVGKSLSAKSTCWKVLAGALTRLCKKERAAGFSPVRTVVINPKALSLEELYGCYDSKTHEWTEGVVATVMRNCSADTKPEEKWIVFDGNVDTLWIESMNSVLDDNKVLTLVNGERIFLSSMVSLIFEVEDLKQASPATVSRCGMVYMEENTVGWKQYVESWIKKLPEPECKDHLRTLFNKFVQQTLDFKARECKEIVKISDLHAVMSLCNLYEAVATVENGVTTTDTDFYLRMVELWFIFSLIWSIGAAVTEEGRKKMDMFLRELEGQFPHKDTIYDCVVDPQRKGWAMWEEKLQQGWRYNSKDPFHKILVPTVDTLRNSFIVSALIKAKKHVLLVGSSGTGKTVTIQGVLESGPLKDQVSVASLNFSARTTSNRLQDFVEGYVDKRTMHVFVPRGGKKLVTFIDDLNLPKKDTFGSQPPLELLRQWIDYGFWYDRVNATPNNIKDMQLVCAMAPPGGGRNEISARLLSRFNVINVTFPDESQIKRIFGTIINQKLGENFEEEVKPLGDLMTQATWEVYQAVTTTLLPTPSHMHYVFNLRDMSKVFQGLLMARPDHFSNAEAMVKLWVHEVQRVFGDRLVDEEGRQWFFNLVNDKLSTVFNQTWVKLFKEPRAMPLFTDLVNPDDQAYQDQPDIDAVRKALECSLEEYVVTSPMDLVLFRDAIQHVCRIHRIIRQPRGNALLVGLGGSGRQSLCRLAAFIAGMKIFTIDVRKGFREQDFRDKLKELYYQAGIEEKPTVFLFSDTQILRPAFLEDVSSILSSGEVPNLYNSEELGQVCDALKSSLEAAGTKLNRADRDSLYQMLIDRARDNIHVVLMMSPVGEKFRNSCRAFPAIINNTTIDWFSEWPADALREVAMKCLTASVATAAKQQAAQQQRQQQKQLSEAEVAALAEKQAKEKQIAEALATVCQGAHSLASSLSIKMEQELKRTNHVTPSNFLELLRCYTGLYQRKRAYLESEALKLENGLRKLDDTRTTVAQMGEKLRQMQKQGAVLQQSCDEALVVIVQQKQEASEQAKQIETREAKLSVEEQQIREEKSKATAELEKAMPAFESAKKALKALDRRDLGEIRTYVTPLPLTAKVMEAVMLLRGTTETSWAEAKKQLADIQFIPQLLNYDIESINDALLKKIDKYVIDPDFRPEKVQRESTACMSLCTWVHAVQKCAHVQREVAPKQQALAIAAANLEKNEAELEEARKNLKAINEKLDALRAGHASRVAEKDKLAAEATETETKINRANRLVDGLASERARWEKLIAKYRQELELLPGNCVMAASFVAYAGPFPHNYRLEFMNEHQHSISKLINESPNKVLSCSADFNLIDFIADRVAVLNWTGRGLPNDEYSIQNGVLVMPPAKWLPRPRWPLIVDPEGQANKWIKATERGRNLRVISAGQEDMMRTIENAISYGLPVLLEDVGTEIDPSLDPVLQRRLVKLGSREVIRMEEGKEIDYNPDFRLYVTTKLANPSFGPDITTKMAVVNFAVREQGLQQQLLGHVVMHERRQLEEQKTALVTRIADAQRILSELEEKILGLLSSASGSLLDDEVLVTALETAKTTSEDMKQQLEVSVKTEAKIDHARQAFLPCAVRSSVLFFVLKDLSTIDTMYQFSLDSYLSLFSRSLVQSPTSEDLAERIKAVNEYHTLNVYRTTCRALFEKHKLLFSFQLAVKILDSERKLNRDEYQFFLRGGAASLVTSSSSSAAASIEQQQQQPNPCQDWLTEEIWGHLLGLDKLHAFKNFCSSFEQNSRDWHEWYLRPEPEVVPLPGEWENRCNELEHLLLIRCFRPDRIASAVTSFVGGSLGSKFVEPPAFDPRATFDDSAPLSPILFVLSPGVDPLANIAQLAASKGFPADSLLYHPLGQGQEARAVQLIEEGAREGRWVFLANLHLMVNWLPKLEKVIDDLAARPSGAVSDKFRLWLSSQPHEQFPITLLQRSLKITTQPPKGIKQNLLRIFRQSASEPAFSSRQHAAGRRYRKLFFSLAFFHSVLLERSKFLTLGYNSMYDFNDTDFNVSELLLGKLLDQYEAQAQQQIALIQQQQQQQQLQQQNSQQQQGGTNSSAMASTTSNQQQLTTTEIDPVPWQALRYIIAEINYGGRVTDRWDMNVLSVYAKKFFCPDALAQQNFRLSTLGTYFVPEDGPLQSFTDYAVSLPQVDKPEAFGQHSNADIASQIQEGSTLISSLLSLQPRVAATAISTSSGAPMTREQRLIAIINDLLKRIPSENIQDSRQKVVEGSCNNNAAANDPLLTVLSQEIGRYNQLLDVIRASLRTLQSGILGLIVMSSELDEMAICLFDSRVPPAWKRAYPSLRTLQPWVADLLSRIEMFSQWSQGKQPAVFWLGGFTFPTGFLTALLQKYSLKTGLSIDGLTWEFTFMREPASSIREPPSDGAFITGMSLEGAGWDDSGACLKEPNPMELDVALPVVHFRPIDSKRKQIKDPNTIYQCPCYLFPVRDNSNREKPSYMLTLEIGSGKEKPDFWTLRGTAVLLSK